VQPVAAPAGLKAAPPVAARKWSCRKLLSLQKKNSCQYSEKTVDERVTTFLSSLDIRETILAALMPAMKESVEKVLWEVAPELTEKVLKEILRVQFNVDCTS